MNQNILVFIVLILFALVTVEKVSAFALKRLIDQNRDDPSQFHTVNSLRYQTTRSPYGHRNQPENERMYRTTPNPYRFHYQTPSQRLYRTTPDPFKSHNQQKSVTGEGHYNTRVTPNPNTPYGNDNQGHVTRNYGYRYQATTERPYWYNPNSEYRSTNNPYGYRHGGSTIQSPYYGSNLGPRPVSVTQIPYWVPIDTTTNNDLSDYYDNRLSDNNLSGKGDYGDTDDY